jgi:hypothetical protein
MEMNGVNTAFAVLRPMMDRPKTSIKGSRINRDRLNAFLFNDISI